MSDYSHELRAKCDADLHREFTLVCSAEGFEYQDMLRLLARWYVDMRKHAAMVIVNGLQTQGSSGGTRRESRSSFDPEHPDSPNLLGKWKP